MLLSMKNLRYLITVLALVNIGLTAQAAAASSTPATQASGGGKIGANKISVGTPTTQANGGGKIGAN
jgi:hypothetical protein